MVQRTWIGPTCDDEDGSQLLEVGLSGSLVQIRALLPLLLIESDPATSVLCGSCSVCLSTWTSPTTPRILFFTVAVARTQTLPSGVPLFQS